ncbi:phosphatase PAP2 family protein [Mucilaginibacter jinjuensis]|uniref:Phosphatase PAP2 family protein n=1 Tax=Mucilaginibacter jinjuensis TaxID=1176721 RepID=A0ABY7TC85_9SPHI|nr:phosphatase PAP2 family protein [Mucilaginibacter jinjuensis]WCT13938.1 phosphatase PAP2 family protein [Mucilaginibacter jinjuensis]
MKLRITDVLYRLRLFFIPYLIILSACLIIKLIYTREAIYFTVNSYHNTFADYLFIGATDVGDGLFMLFVVLILTLFSYRKAFLMASSFLITTVLVQIAKRLVHAPRPSVYFTDHAHIYYVNGVKLFTSNSFPSGHTVQAFTMAVVLAYLAKQKSWGFILLIAAILVGYSRMYLSEHFFEDVMAGSIIGTVATIIWLTIIDSKPFIHTQAWTRGLLSKKDN